MVGCLRFVLPYLKQDNVDFSPIGRRLEEDIFNIMKQSINGSSTVHQIEFEGKEKMEAIDPILCSLIM